MEKPTQSELLAAYEEWIGEPRDILKLSRAEEDGRIPAKLLILIFGPSEEDNLEGEDDFAIIATAGLSQVDTPDSTTRVELVLRIQGHHDRASLRKVGHALAEFATSTARAGIRLAPNIVICNVEFPLFDHMDCILCTNVGVFTPAWLPGIDPAVQLLWVKPLYESEADIAGEVGDLETAVRFQRAGTNWDDPERNQVQLEKFGNRR